MEKKFSIFLTTFRKKVDKYGTTFFVGTLGGADCWLYPSRKNPVGSDYGWDLTLSRGLFNKAMGYDEDDDQSVA